MDDPPAPECVEWADWPDARADASDPPTDHTTGHTTGNSEGAGT